MSTYLLTWNPTSTFAWHNQAKYVAEVARRGSKRFTWSFGNRQNAEVGDRVFLIKQGTGSNKGIVGSGYIVKTPYSGQHWEIKGKKTIYVDVDFDSLLDPSTSRILTRDELDRPGLQSMNWDAQASGTVISEQIAKKLEIAWQRTLGGSVGPRSKPSRLADSQTDRQYWWVSHNRTFADETKGGFIWAKRPFSRNNEFHLNLTRTHIGDLVFSYSEQKIKAIGIVVNKFLECDRPHGCVDEPKDHDGWLVPVEWTLLTAPFKPKWHFPQIRPLLPELYAPLGRDGNGYEGRYLTKIGADLGHLLLVLANEIDIQRNVDERRNEVLDDIEEESIKRQQFPKTEKEQLIKARRGQGRFRAEVQKIERHCRLTRVEDHSLLIASHIKAWRESSNEEKMDGNNGLLLSAHVDRLFDRGWISFSDSGAVLPKPEIRSIAAKWGLDLKRNVGQFNKKQRDYLAFHRKRFGF